MDKVTAICGVLGTIDRLKKLLATTKGLPLSEFIIVAQNIDDASVKWIKRQGLRLIRRDEALSFAQFNNLAAKETKADWLLLLNDDLELKSGFWDGLQMMEAAQFDVIGAKLLYPNGTIQHCGKMFTLDMFPFHVLRGMPSDHPDSMKMRRYPGVTFACVAILHELWDAIGGLDEQFSNGYEDDDFCAIQGTPVITQTGCYPIEQINEGTSVLSAKGNFCKVSRLYRRPFKGTLFGIKSVFGDTTWLTGNHPVLTKLGWIRAEDITYADWLWSPSLPYRKHLTSPVHIRQWMLNRGSGQKRHRLTFQGQHRNADSAMIAKKVRMTLGFARLLGYYIAEGSVSRANASQVVFSFASKERQYIDDVKNLMVECFGIEGHELLSPNGRGMRILFYSKALAQFFSGLLGKGAKEKHLPDFVCRLTKGQRIELLKGFWRGDGHHNPIIGFTTASPHLSTQIPLLAASLGLVVSSHKRMQGLHTVYRLDISWWQDEKCRVLLGIERGSTHSGKFQHQKFEVVEGGQWLAVAAITQIEVDTQVYNLGVSDDESYISGRFAVHNCLAALERASDIGVHPVMIATHLESQTTGQDTANKEANWKKFQEKWIFTNRISYPLGIVREWRFP